MNIRFLVPVSILLILLACVYLAGQVSGSHTAANHMGDSTSLAGLEDAIERRIAGGKIAPVDDQELLELLPVSLSGFEQVDENSGTFKGKSASYAEASRIFVNEQGTSITISLADGIGTPEDLRRVYKQALVEEGVPAGVICLSQLPPIEGAYARFWTGIDRGELWIEAGLCYRFLLKLRVQGKEGLEDPNVMCEWFDWDRLATYCQDDFHIQ